MPSDVQSASLQTHGERMNSGGYLTAQSRGPGAGKDRFGLVVCLIFTFVLMMSQVGSVCGLVLCVCSIPIISTSTWQALYLTVY